MKGKRQTMRTVRMIPIPQDSMMKGKRQTMFTVRMIPIPQDLIPILTLIQLVRTLPHVLNQFMQPRQVILMIYQKKKGKRSNPVRISTRGTVTNTNCTVMRTSRNTYDPSFREDIMIFFVTTNHGNENRFMEINPIG